MKANDFIKIVLKTKEEDYHNGTMNTAQAFAIQQIGFMGLDVLCDGWSVQGYVSIQSRISRRSLTISKDGKDKTRLYDKGQSVQMDEEKFTECFKTFDFKLYLDTPIGAGVQSPVEKDEVDGASRMRDVLEQIKREIQRCERNVDALHKAIRVTDGVTYIVDKKIDIEKNLGAIRAYQTTMYFIENQLNDR